MVRTCILLSCVLATLVAMPSYAYPSPSNYFREEQYEPEQLMDMLGRLENLIQMEHKMENYRDDITRNEKLYHKEMLNEAMSPHEKRALDLGLSRGYSGALQAKHLMGIAAANFAGGPGRRRRDVAQ